MNGASKGSMGICAPPPPLIGENLGFGLIGSIREFLGEGGSKGEEVVRV